MSQSEEQSGRQRLSSAGLEPSDLRWLEGLGFNAAAIPPVTTEGEAADYARRAARLSAAVAGLSMWERETALESRLAAAIGARVADWQDAQAGEDED